MEYTSVELNSTTFTGAM